MAESPNSQIPKNKDKDLTHIPKLFLQEADTNQMKTADHNHIDSTLKLEGWWCWKLHLDANQSDNCAWADHALCGSHPHFCWRLPWKPSHSHFGVWAAHSTSLASCNKCCPFFQHNPVSVDWLYCVRTSGPKFCLLKRSKDALLCFFLLFLLFSFEFFSFFPFAVHILKSEATYRTQTSSWRLLCSFLFLHAPWASERDQHTLFL